MPEEEVGRVSDYFSKIGVAAIETTSSFLKRGDVIRIRGAKMDFTQSMGSMEINRQAIDLAEKGSSVGIKVNEEVRPNDRVLKVTTP